VTVTKIASANNLADPFTKTLQGKIFDSHIEGIGLRCMTYWLIVKVGDCWRYIKSLSFFIL